MPEAIATTRRKFYRALDSLTSSTTALPASPSSNKRTSTAAAAFDEARERARKRLRQSTSTTSLNGAGVSVISLPRKVPGRAALDPSKPPPHFSPWSRATFLARLKTFSRVSQWHPKPDPIGEVAWAKRGWVCVDVNTVACKGGCERRLVVSLDVGKQKDRSTGADEAAHNDDEDEAAALEEALAERYRDEIIDGHSESCLWHKAGCKDDIYRLPLVRPTVWQPELRNLFRTLLEIAGSIETVKIRPLNGFSDTLLHDLPASILEADTSQPVAKQAFAIAMHGWRGACEAANEILQCDACFQRVGLWMYQPDYRSARSDGAAEGDNPALIDLVEMHREHCPWRNPDTQKASGSLAGLHACHILHRVVATAARDHRRRSHRSHPRDHTTAHPALLSESAQPPPILLSREEITRQDRERESRLRKLKNMLTFKRKSTPKTPAKSGAA